VNEIQQQTKAIHHRTTICCRASVTMKRLNYPMDSGSPSIMQQQNYHNMDSGLLVKTGKASCTPIRVSLFIFVCCTLVSLLSVRVAGKLSTAPQISSVIDEKQVEKPHLLEGIPTKNETRPASSNISHHTRTAKRPQLDSIVHEGDIASILRPSVFKRKCPIS
jgi:hypothetical protein